MVSLGEFCLGFDEGANAAMWLEDTEQVVLSDSVEVAANDDRVVPG